MFIETKVQTGCAVLLLKLILGKKLIIHKIELSLQRCLDFARHDNGYGKKEGKDTGADGGNQGSSPYLLCTMFQRDHRGNDAERHNSCHILLQSEHISAGGI